MSRSYVLVKPGWAEKHYLLHHENEEVGRIDLDGVTGTLAHVRSQGNDWIFERTGVLTPVVKVRRSGDTADLFAVTIRAGGDGDLTLNGRAYRWKSTNVWRGEFAWVTADETPVIRYRPKVSSRSIEQHIDVVTADLSSDTEHLLVLLGGYLASRTYTDVATLTAVLVATAAVT